MGRTQTIDENMHTKSCSVLSNTGMEATRHFMNRAELHVRVFLA